MRERKDKTCRLCGSSELVLLTHKYFGDFSVEEIQCGSCGDVGLKYHTKYININQNT
jgi:hypothetical protein|tara:strand:+ start:1067 stop:1237 length:171 start_codon:yes stop_codon:yes gene_type:complete